MFRVAKFIAFLLLFASNTVFASWQLNLTPGVTPVSHDIYDLHMTILWICVVIGVGVFGVIFYSVIYHRKSLGVKPAKFHEHLWLELTWTIVPFLILVVMAIPASIVLIHLNDDSVSDLTVKVTGRQWKWEYEYLDQGVKFFSNINTPYAQIHNEIPKTPDYLKSVDHPLVVPIHKKIRFLFTSGDVIHTWFVPALGVQRDAVPGFITESWTRINRPGTYFGQCDKLCGINHAYMPIVVVAMSENDFAQWLATQKGEVLPVVPEQKPNPVPQTQTQPAAATPAPTTKTQEKPTPIPQTPAQPAAATPAPTPKTQEELMKHGQEVFLNTCSVCHQATGEGMPPTFPALKGSKVVTGPLAAHLHTVMFGKPGTAMQAFKDQLSDEDIAAVITYERNSWGNNTKDIVQPSQVTSAKTSP